MNKPTLQPVYVGPDDSGARLHISWNDGTSSEFSPWDVRYYCPCAGCVDEMTGKRLLRPENIPTDISLTAIQYVGRYALQFTWDDGHDTGYFTYTYLQELGRRLEDDEA